MNLKKVLYFTVFGSMVLTGLVMVVYFGLQPKSVPKINLSHFEQPEAIGAAVAQRLRLELTNAPLLVIGVWPGREEEMRAVKGLLDALTEPGLRYDVLAAEPKLPFIDRLGPFEAVDVLNDPARFVEGIRQANEAGRRVVAIIPTMYASQMLPESPVTLLQKNFGLKITSLSLAPFPRDREEENGFEVPCITGEDRTGGFGRLGCAILHKSRTIYRKKKDPTKYAAVLDLVGGRDYLLLMTPPR